MSATATLTADQLLRIPATTPEALFPPDKAAIERVWRALAARWHPDRNPGTEATSVFQHVAALRRAALQRLNRGEWWAPGCVTLTGDDGRAWRLRYMRRSAFELGELLVGNDIAAWIVDAAHDDLAAAALRTIGDFRFADDAMRAAASRYLPSVAGTVMTADRRAVVMRKPADMILLADLLRHEGGRLDARHVAWILSELLCCACWLQWAGLTHNAIAPGTVFVSPADHAVAVLGGWWYAAPAGARLAALPARSVALAPADIVRRKQADPRTDLELIRGLGRDMVADAPPALAAWLAEASRGSARDDYTHWQKVLTDAFGPRRFAALNVRFDGVYR
jgi:hypothetical protein